MTLRSRNTSRENAFALGDERASDKHTKPRQTASNKQKVLGENGSREKANPGRTAKKKQYTRKKRQRAFKNTIVLAPFHALKMCFQNKLRDLYKKGLLESNAKRVKIPNNSLFQYDVMEMGTNQSDTQVRERKKVESSSKQKKSDSSEQTEYCRCLRKSAKQKRPRVDLEVPGTSSTAPAADKLANPSQPKKMRTQTPAEEVKKDEGRKSVKETRGCSNEKRLSEEKEVRRSKTQPKKTAKRRSKKRNNFKYNTRSVTRKETAQDEKSADDGKEVNQTDSQSSKTSTEQKETLPEEVSQQGNRRSNSSVIFLEEINPPKAETDLKTDRAPEETAAGITAVTQMFNTLLKSTEDTGRKLRSGSGSRKLTRRSCSSERRPEEDEDPYNQREIEANVVVQEPHQDSSSSERISEDSRTIDSTTTQMSSSKAFPQRPDKKTSYIFGPKCPFQEFRESCEFGFGMSRTLSDEEVDDCQSGGNVDFKKHR